MSFTVNLRSVVWSIVSYNKISENCCFMFVILSKNVSTFSVHKITHDASQKHPKQKLNA